MKLARILVVTIAVLLVLPLLHAQDAETNVEKGKETVKETGHAQTTVKDEQPEAPLKVQVTVSEFDGTQKISSLPYSLNLLGTHVQNHKEAHLRLGVRVPVSTGDNSFTYQDVGTNIDAMAFQRDDGTYRVDLTVDRSSVITSDKGTDWKPGESGPSRQPMIRSFRDEFTVVAKPGQTVEGTSAVDPVTGHVLKVEVTLSVAK